MKKIENRSTFGKVNTASLLPNLRQGQEKGVLFFSSRVLYDVVPIHCVCDVPHVRSKAKQI